MKSSTIIYSVIFQDCELVPKFDPRSTPLDMETVLLILLILCACASLAGKHSRSLFLSELATKKWELLCLRGVPVFFFSACHTRTRARSPVLTKKCSKKVATFLTKNLFCASKFKFSYMAALFKCLQTSILISNTTVYLNFNVNSCWLLVADKSEIEIKWKDNNFHWKKGRGVFSTLLCQPGDQIVMCSYFPALRHYVWS